MSVVPPDSPIGVRTDVKRFPDSLLYTAHVRPWHARLKQPRVAAVAIGKQRNQEEKTKADEQDYAHLANNKVSDGSQPPMMFDLSLSESAGSRSLHRPVGFPIGHTTRAQSTAF